jgi:hypothetical protein
LLRVGRVVADLHDDLLAHHAALGVEVLDGLLGPVFQLRTEGRVGAGDRAGDPELDLRLRGAGHG